MTRFTLIGGSMIAAFAASLCCILPVVAALLGVTSFAAASSFEQSRPYFLALAGTLLVCGFLRLSRDRNRACAPGDGCENNMMKRWSAVALGVGALTVVGLATFPHYSGQIIQAVSANSADSMKKAVAKETFIIEGMTCKACATGLQATLERLPGVAKAAVDYEGSKATISFDPAKQDRPKLEKAIVESGYRVKH